MTPRAVMRLHEAACRARAYPTSRQELAEASRVLSHFHRRPELIENAEALASSGIAGTPIDYRFFWPMARWLADRFPRLLTIDWREAEFADRLAAALPLLMSPAEGEALRRSELPARAAIERLRAPRETDAVFLLKRLAALPGGDPVREATHDALDIAYRLEGAPSGPSRTRAYLDRAPFAVRPGPPARSRPDLVSELARPPRSVRALSPREGARVLDLARAAMVTRSRDLDAFTHGDARDVRLIDDGDGLAFALIGVVPERRAYLPAVYGALTLRNRVPIGYVQLDVLFGNAEVSFNTFPTFRGGEAGFVFARLLSACRHVFDVRSFTIEPYQLGRKNDEGIESGAWWFYARFGFRPRDPGVLRLARAELEKRARNPRYRSSARVLSQLAEAHLYWSSDRSHPPIVTPYTAIGFALARKLSAIAGADREAAVDVCASRVAARLGLRGQRGWTRDERLWWRRLAPLIDAIPGWSRWTPRNRHDLVTLVRAKGGRRESEYVRLCDRHPLWTRAVLTVGLRGSRLR